MRLETSAAPRRVPVLGLLICALHLGALQACGPRAEPHELEGVAFGTTWSVRIDGSLAPGRLEDARRAVQSRLEQVDRLMSTFDSTSELTRFNRHAGTGPVAVHPDLIEVLARARRVSERSGGAFDPTVAPLVDAWGFGPPLVVPRAPGEDVIASLLERVGWERIAIDTLAHTVAKTHPLAALDLSGIAKGWAAERVAAGLAALGIEHALVEVGGELQALGTRGDGRPWRIGIERPDGEPGLWGTIDLTDAGLATSGDYRNWFEDGGATYAHIIDPRTGRAVPRRRLSVTVVHPDASIADAWATALLVLGPEEGDEVARREGVAALFLHATDAGIEARLTPALERGFVTSPVSSAP
ncbi:MAG TPA: FAD:protein FMN transferase [Longimicrobiales bacterium]|nr:FAD:protein FMN transferase [Longimicrobiales bacterium]